MAAITAYRNFDLLITRAGERYKAIVTDAPAGEESVLFDPPFAADALPRLEGLARGVTRGSARSAARAIGVADDPGPAADLAEVGSRLFAAVFAGPVGSLLAASQASVAAEDAGLRLRLRVEADAAELALLPWETLYDPAQGHFVGLGEASPVLRYLALPRSRSALPVKPPLRVLAVLASPAGLHPLDVEREWQTIQEALADLVADGKFVLERLASPTLDALQRRLLGEPVHILHFIGHGVFDEASQAGSLAFADARGRPHLVRGDDLAKLLRNHPGLRLTYLNACQGALASGGSVFTGVAQSLVREGVPAAVAMQAEISDPGAIELARTFYSALAAGRPVDAALTQARVALSASGSGEWAIPVLFSRSPDNRLFDIRQVLPTPDCPYPGMAPFSEAQKEFFFGRDREIAEATARLRQHPFLAIIGASGSGKSSLVNAGVIPALRKSRRAGAGEWEIKTMRPSDRRTPSGQAAPMQALAELLDLTPQSPSLPLSPSPHLPTSTLLFVDQLEEAFTLAAADEAQAFLEALGALIGQPNLAILLTARADFYPELMACALWPAIKGNRLELPPLGDDELWAAIVEPANRVGVTVDEALAVRLIADASGQRGVLPLVQETLVLLWDQVAERQLGLKAYQALARDGRSGLQVAIDRRASVVYDNLPAAAQPIARRIFLRLVQFGEGRADTRRQQTAAELRASGDDPALFEQTLATLTASRLLTASGAADDPDRRLDIAHEALIAGWPRLQEWLGQRRAAEQTRRRLETKATEWLRTGQRGGLLDEYELQEAEGWLTSEDAGELGVSRDLVDLVTASKDVIAQAAAEQEAQRQRELEQARKLAEEQRLRAEEGEQAARGLRKRLIAATIAALIAALAFGAAIWFAVQSQIAEEKAQHEERRARVGELAASAQVELAQTAPDHSLALLLAQEGISVTQRAGDDVNPANYRVLAEGVNAAPKLRLTLPPHLHAGPIYSIVFSPQCLRPAPAANQPCPRALLTTSEDEVARLWDPETLEQLRQFPGHDGPVFDARFSPDGSQVLTVGFDGTIRIWSVADDDRQPQGFSPPDEPLVVGFTADGPSVVTVGRNSTTRVWDVATGRETRQIPAAAGATLAALSPDGTTLAVVTDQDAASVLLIEVASGAVRRTLPVGQEISSLEFLSDGATLVVYNEAVTLWNAADGRFIEEIPPDAMGTPWLPDGTPVHFDDQTTIGTENPAGEETPWQGVTLSTGSDLFMTQITATGADPAGGFVAAGGYYGELYTWRLPNTRPVAVLGHAEGLTALAFGAGDTQLVIGGGDGRLSLWDVTTGKQVIKPFVRELDTGVTQVRLSEDGSQAAAVTQVGLGVWDARSGQLFAGTKFRGGDSDWPDIIQFIPGGAGSLNPEPGAPGLLVYSHNTRLIYLYDPRSDTIRPTFAGKCESPTQMAVSRDGTTLAIDCAGQGIMVWQGGSETPTIVPMPDDRMKLKALYSGGLDGVLRLLDAEGRIWNWSPKTKQWSPSRAAGIGQAYAAAFSPDGNILAVALPGGAVSLVDVTSGKTVQTWRHGSAESATAGVTAVTFSNDGLTLATAGDDGRVRLWDVSPGARYRLMSSELPATLPARYCAASNNDNCRVIVAAPLGRLLVWETSANLSSILDRIPISQTLLRIAPDGRYAAVQAADKRLCAWDMTTAQEAGCLPRDQSGTNIQTMAIGGTEPTLVTWDRNDLRLWRLPGLDLERRVPVTKQDTLKAAISPAAPILAVVESGVEVKLWDIGGAEAKLLHRLPSPQGDIQQITFSQDGSTLWMASGRSTSGLISRWHTATGQDASTQRLRLDTAVNALAVSPTGDRLAVGGADGMIYLWDTATGQEVTRLNAGSAAALAFNGNGRVLFSAGGQDSPVRIWPLEVSELLEQAAARISRDPLQLTGAERRRYGLSDVQK